jgi:hypothetical protein
MKELDPAILDMENAHAKHNSSLEVEPYLLRATIREKVGDAEGAVKDITMCMKVRE